MDGICICWVGLEHAYDCPIARRARRLATQARTRRTSLAFALGLRAFLVRDDEGYLKAAFGVTTDHEQTKPRSPGADGCPMCGKTDCEWFTAHRMGQPRLTLKDHPRSHVVDSPAAEHGREIAEKVMGVAPRAPITNIETTITVDATEFLISQAHVQALEAIRAKRYDAAQGWLDAIKGLQKPEAKASPYRRDAEGRMWRDKTLAERYLGKAVRRFDGVRGRVLETRDNTQIRVQITTTKGEDVYLVPEWCPATHWEIV